MSNRRVVALSVFVSALAAQACLVSACGGDDVMSNEEPGGEDAATDQSVHDAASTDGAIASDGAITDASTSDSTTSDAAADAAIVDASDAAITDASDAGTSDAGGDAGSDAAVDSGVDAGIDAAVDSGTDASARYSHTVLIDGTNDFTAAETFATTSTGYTGYLAWDDTYLYVGVKGSDVASNDGHKEILLYLGGASGTTTGLTFNTQQPGLPFPAAYEISWKADNSSTDAQAWSGTAWTEASWNFTGNVFENGDYFEMRVPLAKIGSPTSVSAHLTFVNTTAFAEGTYSGVPSGSFVDGYDPDYTKYLQLDLRGAAVPNASPVLP